jgi:hypothetical protein
MNISRAAKVADRIEIRLTGLDKGKSEDLYVAIRNASDGRSLNELSTLTPPAGSAMTIAAARWAARLQEIHSEFVTYQDGAIVINVSARDFVGVDAAEWEMLNEILKGTIAEVVSERPARAGGVNSPQSPREKAVRNNLAAYYAGS